MASYHYITEVERGCTVRMCEIHSQSGIYLVISAGMKSVGIEGFIGSMYKLVQMEREADDTISYSRYKTIPEVILSGG